MKKSELIAKLQEIEEDLEVVIREDEFGLLFSIEGAVVIPDEPMFDQIERKVICLAA